MGVIQGSINNLLGLVSIASQISPVAEGVRESAEAAREERKAARERELYALSEQNKVNVQKDIKQQQAASELEDLKTQYGNVTKVLAESDYSDEMLERFAGKQADLSSAIAEREPTAENIRAAASDAELVTLNDPENLANEKMVAANQKRALDKAIGEARNGKKISEARKHYQEVGANNKIDIRGL